MTYVLPSLIPDSPSEPWQASDLHASAPIPPIPFLSTSPSEAAEQARKMTQAGISAPHLFQDPRTWAQPSHSHAHARAVVQPATQATLQQYAQPRPAQQQQAQQQLYSASQPQRHTGLQQQYSTLQAQQQQQQYSALQSQSALQPQQQYSTSGSAQLWQQLKAASNPLQYSAATPAAQPSGTAGVLSLMQQASVPLMVQQIQQQQQQQHRPHASTLQQWPLAPVSSTARQWPLTGTAQQQHAPQTPVTTPSVSSWLQQQQQKHSSTLAPALLQTQPGAGMGQGQALQPGGGGGVVNAQLQAMLDAYRHRPANAPQLLPPFLQGQYSQQK